MKKFDLYGIGSAIVDILVSVSEEQFKAYEFERGSMQLVSATEQQALLADFADAVLASGGSVANSLIALAQLGGKAAFGACFASDRYGLHYKQEFDQFGIVVSDPFVSKDCTATCAVLITPDAERTMRTHLGIAAQFSAEHVSEQQIRDAKWLFIEGYLFANPETGQRAALKAIEYAKRHNTKIAITCSDSFIVEIFGAALRPAIEQADLVFANEREACVLTGTDSAQNAWQALQKIVPSAVVTAGAKGAFVSFCGVSGHVESFPCTPVDLTGAGDMFAGAFLYGVTHNKPPLLAAEAACLLASKVISQVGARLKDGCKEGWDEIIKKG